MRARRELGVLVVIIVLSALIGRAMHARRDAATGMVVNWPSPPAVETRDCDATLAGSRYADTCWIATDRRGETIWWFNADGTANCEAPTQPDTGDGSAHSKHGTKRDFLAGGWRVDGNGLLLRGHMREIHAKPERDKLVGYNERGRQEMTLVQDKTAPRDVAGRWKGHDDRSGDWTMDLRQEGHVDYWGQSEAYGAWTTTSGGRTLTFTLTDPETQRPHSTWTARVSNSTLQGTATNVLGENWSFTATR